MTIDIHLIAIRVFCFICSHMINMILHCVEKLRINSKLGRWNMRESRREGGVFTSMLAFFLIHFPFKEGKESEVLISYSITAFCKFSLFEQYFLTGVIFPYNKRFREDSCCVNFVSFHNFSCQTYKRHVSELFFQKSTDCLGQDKTLTNFKSESLFRT